MRQVKIKKLTVENFKGLRNFSVDFDEKMTQIVGANGTGKTTLHDAYLWLLMGMDSSNRKGFSVQPLDGSSETIHHLTTTVTGVFEFSDGSTHEIKRCLEETWTRRRGTKEDVLTGSETERFIDNVPMKAGEFDKTIVEMFCKMEDFELISSIRAFGKLDMKAKRNKLIEMAGEMPELVNQADYPKLYDYYQKTKKVEDIKRMLKFEMDKLKVKQSEIPVKMTENERNLPTGIDFDDLRKQKAEKEAEIEKIDATLQKDASSRTGLFSGIKELNEELERLNAELMEIEQEMATNRNRRLNEVNEEISAASIEVREKEGKLRLAESVVHQLHQSEEQLKARKTELGKQWEAKNAETWPDTIEIECPTCHRPYEQDQVQEMRNAAIKSFNEGKAGVLSRIVSEGNLVVKQLGETAVAIKEKEDEIGNLKTAIEIAKGKETEARGKLSMVPTIDNLKALNKEYQTVTDKKYALKKRIYDETPTESDNEMQMKKRKEVLKTEVSMLTYQLAKEQDIAKVEARREELKKENADIAIKIADIDAVLFEISTYQRAYINAVEDKVSSMFRLVRWKMYQPNVSNDGEQEICECLVNGVPVSTNVNTAGTVNAGIDIINALSKWLGISVPLWIDGKESVTDLLYTEAQVITLSVVENQPLTVL